MNFGAFQLKYLQFLKSQLYCCLQTIVKFYQIIEIVDFGSNLCKIIISLNFHVYIARVNLSEDNILVTKLWEGSYCCIKGEYFIKLIQVFTII